MYDTMQELQAWLMMECEQRNLSWSEASRRAGISSNSVSHIMNGQRPGLEVCKALALYFNKAPETVLRMAGHLPPIPLGSIDPELRHKAEELQARWRRVREVDPEAAENLMRIAISQADMVLAAVIGANELEGKGEPERETIVPP